MSIEINEYILKNYENTTVTNLAKELGVTRAVVTRRAKKMGLEKEKTFIDKGYKKSYLDPPLNRYFITEEGEVVNAETNKVLKYKITGHGYPLVTMQVNKVIYEKYLHRLLAEAFIPNELNKPQVNHKDGNKENYKIDNLEWVTPKENAEHASRTGLLKTGEMHPSSKITEKQAKEIKNMIEDGYSNIEIIRARSFATRSIVEKIRNKRRWIGI